MEPILGAERARALSHAITEEILRQKMVRAPSKEILLQKVKEGISLFLKEWMEVHKEASFKVQSIKRGVLPDSAEWEALYTQFFEEKYIKTSPSLMKERAPSQT